MFGAKRREKKRGVTDTAPRDASGFIYVRPRIHTVLVYILHILYAYCNLWFVVYIQIWIFMPNPYSIYTTWIIVFQYIYCIMLFYSIYTNLFFSAKSLHIIYTSWILFFAVYILARIRYLGDYSIHIGWIPLRKDRYIHPLYILSGFRSN